MEEIADILLNPFWEHCKKGNYEKIKFFLNVCPLLATHDKSDFIDICETENIPIIELFIKHGADIHIDNDYIFCMAVIVNRQKLIKYLLESGISEETQEKMRKNFTF